MDPDLAPFVEKNRLAVAFAREFVAEVGEQPAMKACARAFEKLQVEHGKKLAERLGSNTLPSLAEDLRKRAEEIPGLNILDVTDTQIVTKITRCRAFLAFQHLGMPDLCKLYCASDDAFIKAFNPKMKLIRTKTIAGGDEYCDHIWAIDE